LFEILKLHYGAMRYPLDGGCNEKKLTKNLCPPSVGVYVPPVVESARRYKCGHVQCRGVHNVDGYCSK